MAIEKMRLLKISGSKENLEKLILTSFASTDLHAELASHVINDENGGSLLPEDNSFEDYLKRINSMAESLHTEIMCAFDGETRFTHQEIEAVLEDAESKFEKINEVLMIQSSLSEDDREALKILKEYDIHALNHLKYSYVTFGRLPISSIPKVRLHEEDSFVYHIMTKNNHYAWIFVVALLEKQKEVNDILESVFFEPIAIPKIDEIEETFDCESSLGKIYGFVSYYAELTKYYKYVSVFDDTLMIMGYVPQRNVKPYKSMFGDLDDVVIEDLPVEECPDISPPTVLRNNRFSKPFEMFVEMYGLPRYGDFDPTNFIAVTYSLLFGMMFGDLGQGAILLVLGWYLGTKKNMTLGKVMMRLGFVSMLFGLAYGSFFGDEEILTPLFYLVGFKEKPIHVLDPHSTMPLLLVAVGVGVTLITLSISLNIYLRFKKKDYANALFSQNGVAGLVFYLSVIAIFALQMGFNINLMSAPFLVIFIGIPLLVILMHVPLKNLLHKVALKPHGGWSGYIMESFFEVFEVVLSFMSNTMSFLRVGGFILSHAGMMLVVMTLKEMTGSYGILVMAIGNVFVIALEGLIVGIQTLRLQYYEMFSRYFEGGGKKYVPTALIHR